MLLRLVLLLVLCVLGVQQAGAQTEPPDTAAGSDEQVIQPAPASSVDGLSIGGPVARAGLVGSVLTSGRCPVPIGGIGRGQTCLDIPFQTTLLIRSADTQQQVTSLTTASDGTFSIALPPGSYMVDPLLADGNPPYQSSIAVDVGGDSMTELRIRVVGGSAVRLP